MGCPCLAGHTGRLLKALLGTSIIFLLAHFVFQICLYTLPVLDQLLGPSCEYGVPGQPAMGVPTPALALLHLCSPRLHPLPAVPRGWTPPQAGDAPVHGSHPAGCWGAAVALRGPSIGSTRCHGQGACSAASALGTDPVLGARGRGAFSPRGSRLLRVGSEPARRGSAQLSTSLLPRRQHLGGPCPAHRGHQVRVARWRGAGGWQWQGGTLEPFPAPLSIPPQAGLERHPQLGASRGTRRRHPAGLVPLPVPVPPPRPQGWRCCPWPETGVLGAP